MDEPKSFFPKGSQSNSWCFSSAFAGNNWRRTMRCCNSQFRRPHSRSGSTGSEYVGYCRRRELRGEHSHAIDQSSRPLPRPLGAGASWSTLHPLEHADKIRARVCCGPPGADSRCANANRSRVQPAQSSVLARGLPTKRLDAASSGRQVPLNRDPGCVWVSLFRGTAIPGCALGLSPLGSDSVSLIR
jgi:hypothetical protein